MKNSGVNGERIKSIDKSNKIAACPMYDDIENRDHVLFYDSNNNAREELVKGL